MPNYVLVPGYIISKKDGDRHFITGKMLQRLYKVDPSDCIEAPTGRGCEHWEPPENAIYLRPKQDGDYSLPSA